MITLLGRIQGPFIQSDPGRCMGCRYKWGAPRVPTGASQDWATRLRVAQNAAADEILGRDHSRP